MPPSELRYRGKDPQIKLAYKKPLIFSEYQNIVQNKKDLPKFRKQKIEKKVNDSLPDQTPQREGAATSSALPVRYRFEDGKPEWLGGQDTCLVYSHIPSMIYCQSFHLDLYSDDGNLLEGPWGTSSFYTSHHNKTEFSSYWRCLNNNATQQYLASHLASKSISEIVGHGRCEQSVSICIDSTGYIGCDKNNLNNTISFEFVLELGNTDVPLMCRKNDFTRPQDYPRINEDLISRYIDCMELINPRPSYNPPPSLDSSSSILPLPSNSILLDYTGLTALLCTVLFCFRNCRNRFRSEESDPNSMGSELINRAVFPPDNINMER